MAFVVNMDVLVELFQTQKVTILKYIRKNFKENLHYIKDITYKNNTPGRGGQNRDCYLLTESCFDLIKNSYNLRNRYITSISSNVKCVNIAMSIENSTVGFIVNSFQGLVDMKRQQKFDEYRVDLYFPSYKLIVECDEDDHRDRNADDERIREEKLVLMGNTMIRFNPSEIGFDLSNVLKEINSVILKGVSANNVIRL
jgi:very-short-patch-repair endonuclease